MAPRPTAERPPSGLTSYWTHTWDHALAVMQDQETWAWELKPLLDEYVFALRAAEAARENDEPTQWDKHAKRAQSLADTLLLTPTARRRHGIGADQIEEDPFARFAGDELKPRREARGR